jgi:hypothetical protein
MRVHVSVCTLTCIGTRVTQDHDCVYDNEGLYVTLTGGAWVQEQNYCTGSSSHKSILSFPSHWNQRTVRLSTSILESFDLRVDNRTVLWFQREECRVETCTGRAGALGVPGHWPVGAFLCRGWYLFLRERSTSSAKFVYYESMKRKLKRKPIYECRWNGRLQTKRFTRLSHTGLVVELEHVKIKTRLTNEKFASVKGECEI